MGILRTDKISGLETPTAVTGSVSFDGTGDYLNLATSTDFSFSHDFTVEAWAYPTDISSKYNAIFSLNVSGEWNSQGNGFVLSIGNLHYGTGYNTDYTNGIIPINTWTHLAVTRSNGAIKIFVNGVLDQTINDSNSDDTFANGTGNTPAIGLFDQQSGTPRFYFTGYISNLRVLKGTALYTADFTPPTHELEVIGDTVLLCCNNPDSAGAEATGKTITVNGNAAASTFSPGLTRDFTFGTQFEGVTRFDTQGYFVPPSGTTEQRGRGRGVFGGGYAPGNINTIAYIEIQTQGNALDFGDLSATARRGPGCVTNSTRAVWMGGVTTPLLTNIMDFVTIASTGNATDFGDAQDERRNFGSVASNTRGVFGNGINPAQNNIIDFITIGSLGTTTDFGDSSENRGGTTGSACSPTRGLFAGGYTPASSDTIDFITIATTGNAQDFGNLTIASRHMGGASSSTRGVFSGGNGPANENFIDFVTIATTGNAQDFGDLTQARENIASASNSLRGVFYGGIATPTQRNTIDFVTISTTGNALDFGDAIVTTQQAAGGGDSHGGLS